MDRIQTTVYELQRRFETLTPAPRISKSLKALVAEGIVNPDEILALIRLEPLLAARLIREANQLPDARHSSYASIEEAATAVGFQRMRALLVREAYRSGDDADPRRPSYPSSRWKRSVTCAVCMESLALKRGLDSHLAYSLGLLHSMADAVAEARPADGSDDGHAFGWLEEPLGSFSGAGLGSALFRSWGFPVSFTEPVRCQFEPLESRGEGMTACLLNLAKWITGVIRETEEVPGQADGPDALALNLLGEGEQTLWNLVTDVSDGLARADAILAGDYGLCAPDRPELSEGAY